MSVMQWHNFTKPGKMELDMDQIHRIHKTYLVEKAQLKRSHIWFDVAESWRAATQPQATSMPPPASSLAPKAWKASEI